jgi:hypothetical protein
VLEAVTNARPHARPIGAGFVPSLNALAGGGGRCLCLHGSARHDDLT